MTSNMSDLDLLELQIEALFTHDAKGRLVAINEPGGGPAPRLFFGRTREGNLWRVRHDVPESIASRLGELAASEPVVDDLAAMPGQLDAMLAVLGKDGEAARVGHCGPAYRFPAAIPVPANATRITRANLHLLRRLVADLEDVEREFEQGEPCLAMIVEGMAVALCYSARLTARAAEAGVETLEGYRGRGYATAVVAAWARTIRETGRIPLYSTSWDNLASRVVARKLGLVHYGSDLSLW